MEITPYELLTIYLSNSGYTIFWTIVGFVFFFGYPYIAKAFSYKKDETIWIAPEKRVNSLWWHGFGVFFLNGITHYTVYGVTELVMTSKEESMSLLVQYNLLIYILTIIFSFAVYTGIVSLYTHDSWKLAIRKVSFGAGLIPILELPLTISCLIKEIIETQLYSLADLKDFNISEPYIHIYIIPFLIIFLISKKSLDSFFNKLSGGEFNAPSKRFNLLLLLGLFCFAITMLTSVGVTLVVQDIYPDPWHQHLPIHLYAGYIACMAVLFIFWLIMCYFPHKTSPALAASRLLYAYLEAASWILIIAAACVAIVAVLIIAAVLLFIWLILTFATAEEFTVKTGGLFGTTKKIWGNRNLDGTVTGLDGKEYKKNGL